MELTNAQRAKILIGALPYIQKYAGKIIVVKYGGNAMTDEKLKKSVMGDIVLMTQVGIKVVLVHGGGPDITELLGKIGKKSEFVDGLRVTDKETVDVALMVLAGKINKTLVSHLQRKGGKAIGLCGVDGGMIKASQKVARTRPVLPLAASFLILPIDLIFSLSTINSLLSPSVCPKASDHPSLWNIMQLGLSTLISFWFMTISPFSVSTEKNVMVLDS